MERVYLVLGKIDAARVYNCEEIHEAQGQLQLVSKSSSHRTTVFNGLDASTVTSARMRLHDRDSPHRVAGIAAGESTCQVLTVHRLP